MTPYDMAKFDEAAADLRESLAPLCASFYKKLTAEGVPVFAATQITCAFLAGLVRGRTPEAGDNSAG